MSRLFPKSLKTKSKNTQYYTQTQLSTSPKTQLSILHNVGKNHPMCPRKKKKNPLFIRKINVIKWRKLITKGKLKTK